MNSYPKHRARNLREIRDAVHGQSNPIKLLTGEYVSGAINRVLVRVNNFAVGELRVENEEQAIERYPRFWE